MSLIKAVDGWWLAVGSGLAEHSYFEHAAPDCSYRRYRSPYGTASSRHWPMGLISDLSEQHLNAPTGLTTTSQLQFRIDLFPRPRCNIGGAVLWQFDTPIAEFYGRLGKRWWYSDFSRRFEQTTDEAERVSLVTMARPDVNCDPRTIWS